MATIFSKLKVMKFLKQEYDDLQHIIKSKNLDPSTFKQTKKRGHLYIEQDGRKDQFCFFRKKETILNDHLQWEEKVKYYLDSKNKMAVNSWEAVLQHFSKWLDGQ